MHRCLQIPEILCIILDILINDAYAHKGGARFHALAAMKTCRTFREPAAERLWKWLHNIVPLITTMPDDLWEISNTEGFQCEGTNSKLLASSRYQSEDVSGTQLFSQRFKRVVQPSDWTRFDMYAGYLRGIGLFGLGCEKSWTASVVLDDDVIFELKRRIMPIIPNLRSMVVFTNNLALAPTLFTSRLQRLRLIMRAGEAKLLTRLATALPVFAPHLRFIELSPSGPWLPEEIRPLQPAIATLLRQLELTEFTCRWPDFLTEEMLCAVVHMPSLCKLYVTIDLKIVYAAFLSNPMSNSSITRFSIDTKTVTTALIPKVISMMSDSNLEAFSVFGNTPDKPSDLEDITSTIGKHCSPVRLVEFELQYGNPALAGATFTTLRPLLPFSSLRHVILTSHLFSLTDNNAKTLAQSWPRLEILMLSMSGPISPTVYGTLTLHGVLSFAKYCKNMKALAVEFTYPALETETDAKDSMANSIPAESEAEAAANSNTWYLGVGKSVISEARPVASFLRALFPQLVLLTWAGTPGLYSENGIRWLAVEEMIRNNASPDQET